MSFIKKIFQKIFAFLGNFLFPKYCLGCQKEGSDLCDKCLENLTFHQKTEKVCANFSVTSFYLYEDEVIAKCIKKGKYKFSPEIFERLSAHIANHLFSGFFPPHAVFVPVPLHTRRLQKRGYNQSEYMARGFQQYFPEIFLKKLVKRVKNTLPQARKSREERKINLKNAFAIDKNIQKKISVNTPIVVVDDVLSTGSTLLEIALILQKAGYKNISGITLARS
jgi:ComF family protein